MYYSELLQSAMKGRLEELASFPSDTRHALDQEVDIARLMAAETVKAFDSVYYGPDAATAEPALRAKAYLLLKDALNFVADISVKSVKVRQVLRDTVAIQDLDYLMREIGLIIETRVLTTIGEEATKELLEEVNNIYLPAANETSDPKAIAERVRAFLQDANKITTPTLAIEG